MKQNPPATPGEPAAAVQRAPHTTAAGEPVTDVHRGPRFAAVVGGLTAGARRDTRTAVAPGEPAAAVQRAPHTTAAGEPVTDVQRYPRTTAAADEPVPAVNRGPRFAAVVDGLTAGARRNTRTAVAPGEPATNVQRVPRTTAAADEPVAAVNRGTRTAAAAGEPVAAVNRGPRFAAVVDGLTAGARRGVRAAAAANQLTAGLTRGLLTAAAAGAAGELAAVALTSTATWLIVRAAGHPPLQVLALAIVGVRAFALARGTLRYAERLAGHDAALRLLVTLRERVYAALARGGPATEHSGQRLTRLVGDVDQVQDLLIRAVLPAVVAAVVAAGATTLCALLLPVAGLVLAAGLLVTVLGVPAVVAARTAALAAPVRHARDDLAVRCVDLVAGAPELAVYHAERAAVAGAEAAAARLARWQRRAATVAATGRAVTLAVAGAATLAVTALAAPRTDPVTVAVLALTTLTAFEVAAPLPAAAQHLVTARDAVRALAAVLRTPPAITETERSAPLPPGPVTVELRDVRVRYHPGAPLALDGVDLRIAPGTRTALVGCNGSGKSTVLAVLARLLEPESGSYLIGDRPAHTVATAEVRARIGGAPQDSYVFHASLRANLTLARPGATDAELHEATRRAGLAGWVASLPDGLDTVVRHDGGTVSGGQRQRLVLARALLADPRVLLLDEPAEGLDQATAEAVLAELLAATAGRTAVLVTHRLAGLADVDEIVVLDAGRVVQRGRHHELAAVPGRYRELWLAEQATGRGADARECPA